MRRGGSATEGTTIMCRGPAKRFHLVVSALLSIALQSCMRSDVILPEMLESYPDVPIVVKVRDGHKYSFEKGDHAVVVDDSGRKLLRGKGAVYVGSGPQFDTFEGEIPFSEIISIEKPEYTGFYYLGMSIVVVTVLYGIVLALALGGRGFGG